MDRDQLRALMGEDIQRRTYELRAESIASGSTGGGKGVACVLGVLDAYRSVWSPRCYKKPVLTAFVQNGFISDSHDWSEDLATINMASVSGVALNIGWDWYSTDCAQQMRTKVNERIERGKTVGLSVACGIDWDQVADFNDGQKLWTYAEGLGEPMDLYDPTIRKYKGYCWFIPEVTRLIETAVTPVPAVPGSMATEGRSLNEFLRGELRVDLSLEENLRLVRAAVVGVEARMQETAEARESDDRRPFVERLPQLEALRDSLSSLIERCAPSTPAAARDLNREADDLLLDIELARLRA